MESLDVVYWSFETFDDLFLVHLRVWNSHDLSIGNTSDSGKLDILRTGRMIFTIDNIDPVRSGFYTIVTRLNPEPSIPSFDMFMVLGILFLSVIVIRKKIKHKRSFSNKSAKLCERE